MPDRRVGLIARTEERIVELAESQERALMERLDRATSGIGVGQVRRKQQVADELLAAGDQATMRRVLAALPYMTEQERKGVQRRVQRVAPEVLE